jgi:hypothetical protein
VTLRGEARFILCGWIFITLSFIWAGVPLDSFAAIAIDVLWFVLTILLLWTAPRD